MLYIPVNSYGHVGMVSSPNQTFSWASLTNQLTSTLFRLQRTTSDYMYEVLLCFDIKI